MRIRYIVPIKAKTIIPDHWEFPVLSGVCHIVEDGGLAKALEIVFHNQRVELAPTIRELESGPAKYAIEAHDHLMSMVQHTLDQAMSFLQCYYDIGLAIDEMEAKYEGESPAEEESIAVKSMRAGKQEHTHWVTFDMLTRAIMAAEQGPGPKFEAALLSSARDALFRQRFIDSFRYSFLLTEFMYGGGQFKSVSLKAALKQSSELRRAIEAVLKGRIRLPDPESSDTATLLAANPSVDDLIDHLVDKRGFYFHGNIKRKDTWKPEQQEQAKSLAFVAIDIASTVAQQAAAPMFDETLNQRYFEYAKKAGAKIVLQVDCKFKLPEENISRGHQINFTTPGTKVTPKLAQGIAKQFLEIFEQQYPTAGLESIECVIQGTQEKAFEMKFYTTK